MCSIEQLKAQLFLSFEKKNGKKWRKMKKNGKKWEKMD